jgi:hypothetical protein
MKVSSICSGLVTSYDIDTFVVGSKKPRSHALQRSANPSATRDRHSAHVIEVATGWALSDENVRIVSGRPIVAQRLPTREYVRIPTSV